MIILIILVIILYIIYINLLYIYLITTVKKKTIQDIYNSAKSGDIVIYKEAHIPIIYNHFIKFTHSGIIIVHPITKEKYVIESHQTYKSKKMSMYATGGIYIYPLFDRLNDYNGDVFFAEIRNEVNKNDVIKFINNLPIYMKNIPFYYDYERYILLNCTINKFCFNCLGFNKNGLFCSEFVAFILKELNMASGLDHRCILPDDLINIKDDRGNRLFHDIILITKNI